MEALLKSHCFRPGGKSRKDIVVTSEEQENGTTVYHLHVAEDDMGRVIGKQGRIAKAIRVVMRAAATRNDKKNHGRNRLNRKGAKPFFVYPKKPEDTMKHQFLEAGRNRAHPRRPGGAGAGVLGRFPRVCGRGEAPVF